jgi:pSer/pThr/pTyr-binding forkhead associated (FHA) protein
LPGHRSQWLLTIEDDEGVVSHHPLSSDRCTIGRARDRDVVLPEVNISRRHARLERRGAGWQIADEGSDNGTFVNGCPVRGPTPIGASDTLQLGGYRIALSAGEAVRELPPPPAPLTPARLRIIAGVDVGAEYPIDQHDFVTIGSAPDCSVRLSHENIAPLHATIRTVSGARYELSDRSGTGLLFVNGRPLVGEQVLEGGDAVNVGGVVLLRFLEPSQWPDPRYDMVSNPDSWLSVDLAPPDDRPTLEELPDADGGRGDDEPLVVLELPDADPDPLGMTPHAPIRRSAALGGQRGPAGRVAEGGEAGGRGAEASEPSVGRASVVIERGVPVGRGSGVIENGSRPLGAVVGAGEQADSAGRSSVVIERGAAGQAGDQGAPSGPASGSGGRPAEDDSTPVSSRRKMLATLRRLASW